MGAAAQVLPGHGPVPAHIVVHGQGGAADLHGGGLGARALGGDELELVGLVGQLGAPLGLGDVAAHEALALLDDAPHAPLDLAQQLGGDGVDAPEMTTDRKSVV